MKITPEMLRNLTDDELITLMRGLVVQIDLIGQEQARRIALASRERHTAQDAEENEGGISS
jgi:hypothetical protein